MALRYDVSTATESTWVRSVYVYGVLLVSGVATIVGLVLAATSVVTLINPESGMSGWERVAVGVPTILDEGIEIAEDYFEDQRAVPDFCTPDLPEDSPDFEYCQFVEEEAAEPVIPEAADEAIALLRDETLRQIRHGAIGKLVIGIVVMLVAFLVFRRHSKLVSLYAKPSSPDSGATTVVPVEPVTPAPVSEAPVVPPPPAALPSWDRPG